MQPEPISDENIEQLLNDIVERFGYDFTDYSEASLKRRIGRLYQMDHFLRFADFSNKVLSNERYFNRFIQEITVNVTEMFRDPTLYRLIRQQVIPVLATHPFVRIWHAGCSTGEEVYSMAILLKEANILQKTLLYATDINPGVLESVSKGIFPMSQMKAFSENYIMAGGVEDFSGYYTARYGLAKFDESLRSRMVISTHNLVSDWSFNEFQLIVCRNVLIYFKKQLQDKVLGVLDQSLERFGFLVLGSKEHIRYSNIAGKYIQLSQKEKIWRKVL